MMEDVVNAVANDPFGIGITGWFPIDEVGTDRRSLAPRCGCYLSLRRQIVKLRAAGRETFTLSPAGSIYSLTRARQAR
jgi:hypothetical protein